MEVTSRKEPTNGGSKNVQYKVVSGKIVVDERNNELKFPPESATLAKLSDKEENFITLALVENTLEINPEKAEDKGGNRQQEDTREQV